nr:reverse transcriptase domain-containing protein [Tanacetum cinerariifolium]
PPVDLPEVPMADNRTMAELLQAPTEDYEDAFVIPEIAVNNFELKHGLHEFCETFSEPLFLVTLWRWFLGVQKAPFSFPKSFDLNHLSFEYVR